MHALEYKIPHIIIKLSTYHPGTKEGSSLNRRPHALIKDEIFPVSNRLLDLILSETIEVGQSN